MYKPSNYFRSVTFNFIGFMGNKDTDRGFKTISVSFLSANSKLNFDKIVTTPNLATIFPNRIPTNKREVNLKKKREQISYFLPIQILAPSPNGMYVIPSEFI